MKVHGIISSYFGDDEWDIGKSVRWTQYFCDTEYAMDVNSSNRARGYIVAWENTFPDVKYGYYSAHNFFDSVSTAADWRRSSFLQADEAWDYDDDDWVIFVDCTEGLCVDDNNPPPGWDPSSIALENPFIEWITEEIAAAPVDTEIISLKTWAFVRNSASFTVYGEIDPFLGEITQLMQGTETYQGLTAEELRLANAVETPAAFSYYTPAGALARLIKVSALRDPGFDWGILDRYEASPDWQANQSLQLITYAYARWSQDPTDVDLETGYPTSEATDDGYRMRRRISRVRPIPGLGTSSWPPLDNAPLFYPPLPPRLAPQSESRMFAEGPDFSNDEFSSDFLGFRRRSAQHHAGGNPWPVGSEMELTTPLYDREFRANPREGLFYVNAELGPVPWNPITGKPAVDLDEWVDANFDDHYYFGDPVLPLNPPR